VSTLSYDLSPFPSPKERGELLLAFGIFEVIIKIVYVRFEMLKTAYK